MEELEATFIWVQATLFFAMLFLTYIQVGAYRRHGHYSFLLLALCSVLNVAYIVLTVLPYVVTPLAAYYPSFFTVAVCAVFIQIPLGVWGTVALFRSYRDLSDRLSALAPKQ
jgi:hypothetical protein